MSEDTFDLVENAIKERIALMSDEQIMNLSFRGSVSSDGFIEVEDGDGFPAIGDGTTESLVENIAALQGECWKKFNTNPQINTSITDNSNSVCGKGFGISSSFPDIDKFLQDFIFDSRNRLYSFLKKFLTRSEIDGELFLAVTLHEDDGFIEVDFMHPTALKNIYWHPSKPTMPLLYEFSVSDVKGNETISTIKQIPSIYVSEFSSVASVMEKLSVFDKQKIFRKRPKRGVFKDTNGYQTFIISWDKGLFTKRNVSPMRTTIEWANHYENLKRYEIDHKKSSGAYLWTFSFEDAQAFRTWMALTKEQKKETGIYQKKTPGGSLILPPGMKMDVRNPNLSSITDTDTDILHMITSGLNKPEDMITGQSNGTYGSVKASRGPESDRTANRQEDFRVFLIYDFFRHILRLHSHVNKKFKMSYPVKVVIGFEGGEEKFGNAIKNAWELIDITFPVSEVSDLESKAKAYLGVKHGSLISCLGIPPSVVAEKLGFVGYRKLRMQEAAEKNEYPELKESADSDSLDSNQEAAIEKPNTSTTKNNEGGDK